MDSLQYPSILYEDSEILVIDKPWGITVNRSNTTKEEKTVQDWTEAKLKIKPLGNAWGGNEKAKIDKDEDFYNRAGIVHRLDKETSGILLIAKTREAFKNLSEQFKKRQVKKIYLALVHGKVSPVEGEINVPVARLPWNRKRFGVVAGGREAITKYKVLNIIYKILGKEKEPLSLLELYPRTGRTHQIRVHLKYFGHSIFSDPLYAGRKTARNDRKILPRLFLHALEISFSHPRNNKMVSFKSPLPEDLNDFIASYLK